MCNESTWIAHRSRTVRGREGPMRRGIPIAGTLVVLLSALDASAQTARVTGRVTDSLTAAPIVGATVSAINPGGSNVVFGPGGDRRERSVHVRRRPRSVQPARDQRRLPVRVVQRRQMPDLLHRSSSSPPMDAERGKHVRCGLCARSASLDQRYARGCPDDGAARRPLRRTVRCRVVRRRRIGDRG